MKPVNRKANKKAQKKSRMMRLLVFVSLLTVATSMGLLHQFVPSVTVVGVDALCPFGGIVSAYTLLTSGAFLQKIALSSYILLAGVLIVAIVFRRVFCGLVCTLGTVQELFARLGIKLFGRRLTIPDYIDRPARLLKYLVLALTLVFTAILGELVIRPYDPWATYQHLFSGELFSEFFIGFIILMIAIVGSFAFDRFFCKYLCPMGAFLGLISGPGLFKIMRNPDTCINCKSCDKSCLVNVRISDKKVVNSAECINCNECVNSCPVENTLYIGRTTKSKITPGKVLGSVLVIFIILIGMTTLAGSFGWTTKTLAEEVQASGAFNPDLIKGRMTLREVSNASMIPDPSARRRSERASTLSLCLSESWL